MATHLALRQRVARRLDQALVSVTKAGVATDDIPRTLVFWTRQMVTDWLNEAYNQLWTEIAEIEPKSLITEADGTYTSGARSVSFFTLLNDVTEPLKLLEVRDVTGVTTGEGVLVPFMEHQDFDIRRTAWESSNTRSQVSNRAWTFRSFNPMRIELFPRPMSALTLRVRYVPGEPINPTSNAAPALRPDTADDGTGDNDSPFAIPAAHHDLLVLYAVVQAKQREEADWRPEWELYQEKLGRFRESIEERQAQSGRRTRQADPSEYDMGHGRRALGLW